MGGFWDGFEKPERVQGTYLSPRKLEPTTLIVAEVLEQPDNTYKGKESPRFLLRVILEDGSEGLAPFAMGSETRDITIRAIAEHLEAGGDPVPVRIFAVGQFIDIGPANES